MFRQQRYSAILCLSRRSLRYALMAFNVTTGNDTAQTFKTLKSGNYKIWPIRKTIMQISFSSPGFFFLVSELPPTIPCNDRQESVEPVSHALMDGTQITERNGSTCFLNSKESNCQRRFLLAAFPPLFLKFCFTSKAKTFFFNTI